MRKSRALFQRNAAQRSSFPQAPPNVYSSDSEDPGPELSRSHTRASAMSNASSSTIRSVHLLLFPSRIVWKVMDYYLCSADMLDK